MTTKEARQYIRNLAVNNYELDADDVEELISQLVLEEVIELKVKD